MFDYIIIGMVYDRPLTGYDIKKNVENGIGVFYKASYGSLYPALKKLTDKKYLTLCEQMDGKRIKKFYQATEEGKAAFFEWLSSPIDFNNQSSDDKLVKVFFFDRLPHKIRDEQLQAYEMNNLNYLRKLQSLEKYFNDMENNDCYYFKLSTLYYGICIVRENIRWCRHLRAGKPLRELLEVEI